MIYLELLLAFLKVGLFSFGGAYGAIPLIRDVVLSHGWMGEEYLASIRQSFDCIERAAAALGDEYTVIVTADHGGHDRGHGTELPEDMTIPLIVRGADFPAGSTFEDTSILDIAPTIAELVGAPCAREWEGKSLVGRAK